MATEAQIEANRRNSQRSTGPRTDAGKAVSAQNAVKHGLYAETLVIDDENAAEFESLQQAWFDDCRPQGQREIALVYELVRCDWLTRRTTALETQLWNQNIDDRREWLQEFDEDSPLAHAYGLMSTTLVLIQRRLTALSRSFHKALHDLERLQAARADTPAPSAPTGEIGFVSKTPAPETASSPRAGTPAAQTPGARIGFVPHVAFTRKRGHRMESGAKAATPHPAFSPVLSCLCVQTSLANSGIPPLTPFGSLE